MDDAQNRCHDCLHREGRLCLAVPLPAPAERLRTGQRVETCPAYRGPDGEFVAIEGTEKASRLRIRF